MDNIRFSEACNLIINRDREKNGIGTLSEKTLHAVLKHYFEPNVIFHEIKINNYVADIANNEEIIEIQTRGFNKLRNKLECFLKDHKVMVVYPIPSTKWLAWIDDETGKTTKKRRSPRKGKPCDAFFELYKIKSFLSHKNFSLCIIMIDVEEYRNLDGWSKDKKKGSSRYERIPVEIVEEIYIYDIEDYIALMPSELPNDFTAKDFKKASGINLSNAQTALNILNYIGAVKRIGKKGNSYIYNKCI